MTNSAPSSDTTTRSPLKRLDQFMNRHRARFIGFTICLVVFAGVVLWLSTTSRETILKGTVWMAATALILSLAAVFKK